MNQVPQELIASLQEVLNSFSTEPDSRKKTRADLRTLLKSQPGLVSPIFEALLPFLDNLPVEFLDILGAEAIQCLNHSDEQLDDGSLGFLEEALLKSSGAGRWNWLTLLAAIQSPNSLDIFTRELLESAALDAAGKDSTESNPNTIESAQALTAFAPLMQRQDFEPDWLFPALFDGVNHSILAPIIFDFANFCYRSGLCDDHPAAEKATTYLALLDQLTNRMKEIESDPTSWSSDPKRVSKMISDSVALIVSLCDAMSLLENESAIESIEKASQLKHRRIRAEATFALAKLGVEKGKSELLKLVHEPVSRLRVIHYAEELGLTEQIDEQFKTAVALAESELAIWLSQPTQMGVPPSEIEFLNEKTMYWPGFDDPVDCFLFRFEYRLGENNYANVAIVGPLVHAFMSNLAELKVDDIYAAFAGWQAEHEEIFELDMSALSPHRKTDLFKLERRLNDFGCEQIETKILAVFFGEVFAVAECQIDGVPSVAFVDDNDVRSFQKTPEMPLSCEIVFSIYKGGKLISAFNH